MRMLTSHTTRSADPASARLVTAYLDRLAAGSRRAMRQALGRVAQAWLEREGVEAEQAPWQRLTATELRRVWETLGEELAPATMNKLLSAVRGVVREARRQQLMPDGVAAELLAVPWVPVKSGAGDTARTLPLREVRILFESCAHSVTPAARRDAAVLAVFLSCGLRRAELAALTRSSFDPAEGSLRIVSDRPGKTRTIELHRPAVQAVRDWLRIRDDAGGAAAPLFPPVNKAGRVGDQEMTPQAVYDLVRRAGRRAGVEDLNSRTLRRTCVVALIASGLPLERVQQRLGHTSWMTTAAYQGLAAETAGAIDLDALPYVSNDRAAEHDDLNPREVIDERPEHDRGQR